jgi:hypothetical protein
MEYMLNCHIHPMENWIRLQNNRILAAMLTLSWSLSLQTYDYVNAAWNLAVVFSSEKPDADVRTA